ncbi:hypothetical protein TA3x_005492 [Tundrisphaera sp. TA3]|uniref:hypothetical protein n=1 Tax=Tundrisphaera sp. TA3 TaxID=3435775 RepID=UPI003EBA49BC
MATAAPWDEPQVKIIRSDEPVERGLTISPAPAPRPALRHRLLPEASSLTPGNAAPIYLRLHWWRGTELRKEVGEKDNAWISVATHFGGRNPRPIEAIPIAEARAWLEGWRPVLAQIGYGAHRRDCDWADPYLEHRESGRDIMAAGTRDTPVAWAALLAIQARVETAEGKFDDAIRTIQTGFAYARHVGRGPFLASSFGALINARYMVDELEVLIGRPGSPNLYWALTALPRPLIDFRDALEIEQALVEDIVPELGELDRPRTDAEWADLLTRLIGRLNDLFRHHWASDDRPESLAKVQVPSVDQFRAKCLASARDRLRDAPSGRPMSDDEALARYLAAVYREYRDERFKWQYLPIPEAAASDPYGREETITIERMGIYAALDEVIMSARLARIVEARLARRIAVLRTVEAIRLHLAAGKGLPRTLDEIRDIPLPLDPATGRPFDYRLDGDSAVISGPKLDKSTPGPLYRITLRK